MEKPEYETLGVQELNDQNEGETGKDPFEEV